MSFRTCGPLGYRQAHCRCDRHGGRARVQSYEIARIARDFCRQQSACSRLTPP